MEKPFQRLIPFQWNSELLAICGGMVVSFLIAGFWYPYWRIAEMDFWIVYNGFLLNAGLPQEYYDHPGYLLIIAYSNWLRGLHSLGLLRVDALNGLPPVVDAAAFSQAWTAATRAGRVLSLLFAMGFVTAFACLIRRLIADWRVAAMAALLLAFSGGMAMQMRILRTELLAASLFYIGLLTLLIAAKRGSRATRPLLIGLAALAITLAMENKIQIVFLIGALPILLLPFGPQQAGDGFWRGGKNVWAAMAITTTAALLVSYCARDLIGAVLLPTKAGTPVNALTYWGALALWLATGIAVYAAVWRVGVLETLCAAFAVVAGSAAGLLALYINYNSQNVYVVTHPLEQMLAFASPSIHAGDNGTVHFLIRAVWGVFERRTFVLESSPRPTIFLEWLTIAMIVFAWRKGHRHAALQASAMLAVVWGVDTLGMARGLKQEYFILTDPLVIVAAALLVAGIKELQWHTWTYRIGTAIVAAHIVVSQAEPVKHIFRTDGPEVLCGLYHNAQKVERLPVCQKQ